MKESEVIQILQHYRHDLLNQLQLVRGYLSMKNQKKAEEKLNELFSSLNEERKLTSLQIPKFALWLLQFNHFYTNFRITYEINMERLSLVAHDDFLVEKCKELMNLCEKNSDPHELYDVNLLIEEKNNIAKLTIYIIGLRDIIHSLEIKVENNNEFVRETENGTIFQFEIPKG